MAERWQDDPPNSEEDIAQSSLRSYLNMSKLYSPNGFFDETEVKRMFFISYNTYFNVDICISIGNFTQRSWTS